MQLSLGFLPYEDDDDSRVGVNIFKKQSGQ